MPKKSIKKIKNLSYNNIYPCTEGENSKHLIKFIVFRLNVSRS